MNKTLNFEKKKVYFKISKGVFVNKPAKQFHQ